MVTVHHASTRSTDPITSVIHRSGSNPSGGNASTQAGPRTPTRIQLLDAGPTCNIGPAELRRRRRAAALAGGVLAVAVGALLVGLLPSWTAPLLAPLAGATTVAILQVTMRFCVAFGLAGVVGMGADPGSVAADPSLLAPHRRRALAMIGAAAAVTVAWVVIAFLLVAQAG